MAHHAEILYQHLYDGLHLNQSGVRLFIKDIKDTALERNRSAPHITYKSTSNHRNLHGRLQHTRDITNNGQSFSKRLWPVSRYYATAAPLHTTSPLHSHHFREPAPSHRCTPQPHLLKTTTQPHHTTLHLFRYLNCSLFYVLKLSRNNTVGSSSSSSSSLFW